MYFDDIEEKLLFYVIKVGIGLGYDKAKIDSPCSMWPVYVGYRWFTYRVIACRRFWEFHCLMYDSAGDVRDMIQLGLENRTAIVLQHEEVLECTLVGRSHASKRLISFKPLQMVLLQDLPTHSSTHSSPRLAAQTPQVLF